MCDIFCKYGWCDSVLFVILSAKVNFDGGVMGFDENVVKLRANARLVKFKFSAAIHLLLFLILSVFLGVAQCSDFGGRVGQGGVI